MKFTLPRWVQHASFFPAAVLQVKDRVHGVRVVPVSGRRIDVAALHLAGDLGVEVFLGDRAVGHVLDQDEVLRRVRHLDVVDAVAPAVADGGQGIDHPHAVHIEDELLQARLLILDGARPHAVVLQGQRHQVFRRPGGDLPGRGAVKAHPYLPVRHHLVADVCIAVHPAVDHAGDQLAVEADGPGIERLVVQKALGNIHFYPFPPGARQAVRARARCFFSAVPVGSVLSS